MRRFNQRDIVDGHETSKKKRKNRVENDATKSRITDYGWGLKLLLPAKKG